jgi:hypothetical protein
MRRVVLLLSFLLGSSSSLNAQTHKNSWSNLDGLKAGQRIEVIESKLNRHDGKFVAVTDGALTLKENGSDTSFIRENIVRVSTTSVPKRGEHALIGLVIGGAIGAGIGAGSSHGFLGGGSARGIGALIGIVIGAPIGAIVGAVIPAHSTVYRATPSAAPH